MEVFEGCEGLLNDHTLFIYMVNFDKTSYVDVAKGGFTIIQMEPLKFPRRESAVAALIQSW